jgi:S-adenosylmethionine-diacylgycerolhomoserine-N-methlytransferase
MLDVAPDSVLIELGGGTAAGLHHLGSRIHDLAEIHVVDCCPSLLAQARQRREREGWEHVQCHQADATTWRPPHGVDVVVLSYALTMMPTWEAVLANAVAMLPVGGRLAVVDFHLSSAKPPAGRVRHGTLRRWFWRRWFAHDGVHLDHQRLDTIYATMTVEALVESDHRLPWLPLRVPYYCCVARKTG